MTKAAFDHIAEGLQEARAIARGEAEPYAVHPITTARTGEDRRSTCTTNERAQPA